MKNGFYKRTSKDLNMEKGGLEKSYELFFLFPHFVFFLSQTTGYVIARRP